MIRKIAAFLLLAGLPLAASTAPAGLAWDSVTKIAMNADQSSLQPGSFDDDFTAAAAQQPGQTGGGIFGKMKQAMAMGQMMQTGFAEHHYAAGSKERTDHLATQTATIVDCVARTITTLDLRARTYTFVSMDQPSTPGAGGGGGGSSPRSGPSDNTRFSISVTNIALGPRTVADQPTNGYRSDVTFTATDSSGESHGGSGALLAYYSNYANPVPACSAAAGATAPNAMMGGYSRLLQALSASGTDSRLSVAQSGPRLPLGMLAMYDAFTFRGGQAQGATFVTERGHVRSINANDPIFSVPPDFTQRQ
jgi:hypothetical protein